MSQTVDSRVVEMRFDNAQFEQNVKQSMTTLDRLKASLNMEGASKSFDELSKASGKVDFSSMAKNIEQLSNRFSTFGIIGMRVIQNLTDSAMKFVHNTMNTVTNSIIGGGKRRAMNIENARFQLQGLLGDEQKVEAIMKDALDSVDGTAYAFDEAAKAASQFAATGMQAGEDMYGALRGITGVAAMTNSEYENISRIFTTVAGNGRMMGDQLLQLSSRGLNAAVTIKDYFNGVNSGAIEANDNIKSYIKNITKGLDVTESDIRDFVSKGKISFDVFAKAMDNAFGEHAKKANDTLTGSISNVKAALARIGAEFVSPLVVQKGPLVMFFNALRERINDIKKNIGPLANMFTDTVSSIATSATRYLKGLSFTDFFKEFNASVEKLHGFLNTQLFDRFGEFTRLITNAGLKLEDFQKAAFDVMADSEIAKAQERNRTVKSELKSYDEFLKKYGSFQASLKSGWMTPKVFSNAIKKLTGDLKPMTEAFKTAEDVVKKFDDISNQVIRGNFGNGAERVKKLTEAGYDYATVQSVVNHKLLGWEIDLSKVTDTQLKNIGYTKEQIEAFKKLREEAEKSGSSMEELIKSLSQPTGAELFVGTLHNVIKAATNVVKTFRDAWTETFTDMPALPLYSFLRHLNSLSEKLILSDDNLNNLKNTFKGALAIFDLAKRGLQGVYNVLANVAKSVDPDFSGFSSYILKFTGFLGNTISGIADWVKQNDIIDKAFTPIMEGLEAIAKKIKEFYDNYVKDSDFTSIFTNLAKDAKSALSDIDKYVGGLIKIFSDFINSILDLRNGFSLDKLKQTFADFVKNVIGYVTDLGGNFKETGKSVSGFVGKIVGKVSKLNGKVDGFGNTLTSIIERVKETLKGFNFGGLIAMLGGAATIKFIMSVYNLITAPKANIVKSFCGVLDQLSGAIGEFRKSIKYENMLKLAIAVAIFTGSILLLSRIETKKLYATVGAVVLLAAALTALNWVSGSIIKIGSKGGGMKKGTSALIEMAIALGIVAFSLKKIEELTDPKGTLIKAGIIVAGLVVASAILEGLNSGTNPKATFASLIGFAGGLYIAIKALKKLESIDVDAVKARIPILIGLFAGIAGLMIASKFIGQHAHKAGAMMLMISIALKLMVSTIMILSLMKPATLNKGLNAIKKIMVIFAGVMVASKFAGQNAHKAGVMFLAMSAALIIMVGAIKLMSLLTDEEMARAMYVIKQITMCFAALMVASKFASGEFKTVIALTVAIAALTIAIGALSYIPIDKLAAATIALSAVMGMMSVMIYTTGKMGSAKRTIPNLLAMVGAVALIAMVIVAMTQMTDPKDAIKIAGALSILLLSITLAMRIISNTKVFKQDTLANLMALTIIVGLMGVIIGLMSEHITNVDSLLPIAASLSILLLSLSGACLILSAVGAFGKSALAGIESLVVLMAAITGFVTAVGVVNDLTKGKLEEFVNSGIPVLKAVGEAIGSFVGGIVGAFLDASGLGDVGEGLKSFIQQIVDFCTTSETINPDVADILPKIAGAILAFAAAEFLDGVSNIISKLTGTKTLGDRLVELADGLGRFADSVSGGKFSEQTVQDAANLAEILATLNDHLPRSGGLAQTILGEKNLSDFGTKLGTLAAGLNNFVANLGSRTYSSDTIDQATTLASVLSALADGLPRAGGLASTILGDKDLSKFGSKLGELATGLSSFVTNLGDTKYSSDTIDQAVKMAETLQVLAHDCPTSGGLLDKIFGGDDLGSFGSSLESLGNGLNKFASSMVGVDEGSADRASQILRSLMDAAALEPGTLYSLATEVGQFSLSMETLGNKLKEISVESLDGVVSAIGKLVTGTQDIVNVDTSKIDQLVESITKLGNVDFTDVGPKLESAASAMSTLAQKMVASFSNTMTNMSGTISNSALTIVRLFSTGLSSGIPLVTVTATRIGMGLVLGFTAGSKSFPAKAILPVRAANVAIAAMAALYRSTGMKLANALSSGMSRVRIGSSLTSAARRAASNVRSYYGSFYSAGEYLVRGFANGISSQTWMARARASAMAGEALRAAKNRLKEKSPSRAFYEIGDYAVQGFANALNDGKKSSYNAGASLAEKATNGVTNAISMINDIVQNGIDARPTISPVLDLTNVQSGARTLGDLLDTENSLNAALSISGLQNRSRFDRDKNLIDQVKMALTDAVNNISQSQNDAAGKEHWTIDVPLTIDGREVAKATATFTRAELNRLDRNQNRREGLA